MNAAAGAAELRVAPGGPLSGTLAMPGDKSITHRALICGALADGESVVRGALDAADTRATAKALSNLGVDIEWSREAVRVQGRGGRFEEPARMLDLGNSGTGLRLLCGVLAGTGTKATLTGDASLRRRPMRRILDPLAAMGAGIGSEHGCAPLKLKPSGRLHAMTYRLPVASAQVKSALLFAGLGAAGETRIEDPFRTRDHTERMLPYFGARLARDGTVVRLEPGGLKAAEVDVPGDFSSAAFFLAAALMVPGSDLVVEGVGVNATRTGLLAVLERMGACIEQRNRRTYGAEPVADIRVTAGPLDGTRVAAGEIPALIDELPILMVVAATAGSASVIEGAGELRHKESDRIASMREGLAALGVTMRVDGDTLHVPGGGFRRGARLGSAGDHRVAMALAVAALAAPAAVSIADVGWVATSFPGFAALLRRSGAEVAEAT